MDKEELKSFLFRNRWRDTKYIPENYKGKSQLYKLWLDAGKPESGIYEKVGDGAITFRRIKLLKTSMRLEIRGITGWKKRELVYYKDLEINPETGKLQKIFHIKSRWLHD